jgi:hypothetical protein
MFGETADCKYIHEYLAYLSLYMLSMLSYVGWLFS